MMEKPNPSSESEDEAFESADEGDLDTGPSRQVEKGIDDNVERSVEVSAEKIQGIETQECDKEEEIEDESTMTEYKSLRNDGGELDRISATQEKDGSNTNSTQAEKQTVSAQEGSIKDKDENEKGDTEEKSLKRDTALAETSDEMKSNSPSMQADANEPTTERIHGVPEDIESKPPLLQAMDRLAEGSTQDASRADTTSSSVPSSSGWGWGSWGNMISKATSSVSSMLETVETQLGIPSPTEIAKSAKVAEPNKDSDKVKGEVSSSDKESESLVTDAKSKGSENHAENDQESSGSGLGSWLSGIGMSQISSVVQSTGKEIVSGGLDALEFVGKKTIDAISQGDPGFRKKRMTLSQALRDAKEKAELSSTQATQDQMNLNTFSVEFDKYQGLANLEALELISRESEHELEKILESRSEESKKDSDELLVALKGSFQSDEDDTDNEEVDYSKGAELDNFEEIITEQMASLSLSVTPAKIISACNSSKSKAARGEDESCTADELYSETISSFAEVTARSVEIFHKIGELMLLPDVKASFLAKTRAGSLSNICASLRATIAALSTGFATKLNEQNPGNDDAISKIITDIYLEASNSSSYVADSFRLLLPIVQLSAVKNSQQ